MKMIIVVLRVSSSSSYKIHITQENQVVVLVRFGLSSSSPVQLTITLKHYSQNILPILSGFPHLSAHQNCTMVCARSPGCFPTTSGSQRLLKFQEYTKVSTSSPVLVVHGVQAGHQKQFLRNAIHTCWTHSRTGNHTYQSISYIDHSYGIIHYYFSITFSMNCWTYPKTSKTFKVLDCCTDDPHPESVWWDWYKRTSFIIFILKYTHLQGCTHLIISEKAHCILTWKNTIGFFLMSFRVAAPYLLAMAGRDTDPSPFPQSIALWPRHWGRPFLLGREFLCRRDTTVRVGSSERNLVAYIPLHQPNGQRSTHSEWGDLP